MILFDQHYENLEGFFYLFQSAAFTFSFTTIKSYDLFITIILCSNKLGSGTKHAMVNLMNDVWLFEANVTTSITTIL